MQKFISSCLFIWDNQTTVDKRQAQEPSIFFKEKVKTDHNEKKKTNGTQKF